jgi:hypothetical protein
LQGQMTTQRGQLTTQQGEITTLKARLDAHQQQNKFEKVCFFLNHLRYSHFSIRNFQGIST